MDEYVIMPNHLHLIIVLGDEINKCGDVLPGRDVLPKHLYFSKISPKQ
ncbi:MAG: hypothetical protein LBQ59_00845 [Candidatus Peribacteria bacterium]|nr:hypothetical protein [Candidatus Peribacteria bacterium]